MTYFIEAQEALDYVYNRINDAKTLLGIGFVGYGDEQMLFQYPAVVVSYNVPVDRTPGPIGTFNLHWQIQLVVYHAKISVDHKTRTREDMQLAAAIRNKLHEDKKAGGGVIFGYITSETPGIVADDQGQANIATRLVWVADSRAPIGG